MERLKNLKALPASSAIHQSALWEEEGLPLARSADACQSRDGLYSRAWVRHVQALPGVDQRLWQPVGSSKERLDRKAAWKLGRLELATHYQSVKPEHQIIRDARAAVRDADPQ